VVIPYRNSGQPIGAILKGQEPSARNYHYSLRNSPEERSSQRERTSGVFQIASFPQISPTKPCIHLPNYLFPSNLPIKTLYASSKLPLSLKSHHQNPVYIFQITSFPQISPPKPCIHLPNYLFPSNLTIKSLYASSKLPLSLKSHHQNPVCIFQVTSFPQISPPKPYMHMSSFPYVPHSPPISFFLT